MTSKDFIFHSSFSQKELSGYDWNNLGGRSMRGSLKDLCRKLSQRIEEHNTNDNFKSHSNLYDMIQNLFSCHLSWDTTASNNFPIYRLFDSLSVDISSKCQSLMLDVLSLHWLQIKRYKNSNKQQYETLRGKYEGLVHELCPLMDPMLVKTKLNAEACHSLKLFTKLKLPKTKDIDPISTLDRRRKTRMYYVQNKFNLLIEESEGFAKLMTEIAEHLQQTHYKQSIHNKHTKIQMNEEHDDDDDDVDMKEQKETLRDNNHNNMLETKIFELIGQFKLDPNRVIDIILHGLEYDVNNDVLLRILKNNFISDNIVTILGFKFRYFQSKKGNKPTPKSLYLLTVHLIHYDIIALHQILPHLSAMDPNSQKDKTKTASTLIEQHTHERKQFELNEKERARLINYVNLNDSVEEKETRQKTELELYKKREEYHVSNKSSQIFELLLHMINYGDWRHCAELFDILNEVHCESKHFINCALMELLHDIISPLYAAHCSVWNVLSSSSSSSDSEKKTPFNPLDESLVISTSEDDLARLPAIIQPIISALNVYLYRGPILYGKICRILCVIMRHTKAEEVDREIEEIVHSLLASYSLIENNSGLSYDLWRLLSQFNFSYRFKFYGYWKNVVYNKYPELWCHREDAIKDTKYLLRRYHVDDSNQKKLGRMFARYIDCHPVLVFELVLAQLQAYSQNVSTVVDGFRYLTHLDRDVLIWCVLVECESKSPKIRRDTYYSDWFRALCDIISQFYVSTATAQSGSACAECDVLPILLYLLNKLLMGYCDHLLMFKKIIQKLTQIEAFGEVITYAQLSCLGGSQLLKQVVLQLDNAKCSRKSKIIKKFSRTLVANGLIISIFVLLNHAHINLSYNYNPNEISSFQYFDLMPTQMDITNDMFVQLFLFMKHHIFSNSKYRDMLYQNKYAPTLSQLYSENKMKVSYCFMLCRLFRAYEKNKDKDKSKENTIVQKMFDVKEIEKIFGGIAPDIWNRISSTAYSIFWSFEIADIFVPNSEYDQQIKRQSEAARQHSKDWKMFTARNHSSHSLRDEEYSKLRQIKKDKKNAEQISSDLVKHKEEQNRTVEANILMFKKMSKRIVIECHKTFLFQCVVPRLLTSDIDAKYTAKFIELMVNSSIRQFYLMDFSKIFMLNFNQILSSSTYSESRRLGRFLADFMLILEKYRENKAAFNQFSKLEAAKYSRGIHGHEDTTVSVMSYDDFCTEFRSMHRSLTIYLVHLMQSNNILWQKNSILVLNEVRSVFPRVLSHAKHLKAKVALIKSNTVKGTSMAVLCERVIAILEKGIDSNSYLEEQKFGGRNLGNRNAVIQKPGVSNENNEHKINELRRKALESQIKKKNAMSSNSPNGKTVKTKSANKTMASPPNTNHVIGQKRRFSQIAPNGSPSKVVSNDTNKRSRTTTDSNNDPKEERDRSRIKLHRSTSHDNTLTESSKKERERSNRKYRESTRDRKSSADNRDRERERDRDRDRSRNRDGNSNNDDSNNNKNGGNVDKRNGTRSGRESSSSNRGRDRGRDRERERSRDKDRERDRERERDRDRDRERERERDRDREREKDKSRDGYREKNGSSAAAASASSASYSYSSSNQKSKLSNATSVNEYNKKESSMVKSASYDKKDRDRSHSKRGSRHRR